MCCNYKETLVEKRVILFKSLRQEKYNIRE